MTIIVLLYGAFAYLLSLCTILYTIAFLGDLPVPKTIDTGATASLPAAVTIDLLLIALFAVQHSVMARSAFKRRWTKLVPQSVERSTYLLFTAAVLLLLFWQWRPIGSTVWTVTPPVAVLLLDIAFFAGWGVVLFSTFLINHWELFGLQQVYARWRKKPVPMPEFRTPSLYKWVRHPLYLGLLIAFWSSPTMTAGHLLFAVANSVYVVIGLSFEERDLLTAFGERYRRYREQVSMLLPVPKRRASR